MKYSKEDLKQWAQMAMQAKSVGDPAYFFGLMQLSAMLQLHPNHVDHYIQQIASDTYVYPEE